MACGVAIHHAGLSMTDRNTVEKSFRESAISVICCTSTLAVGVNLPCHLVIIKNTLCWAGDGPKEYSEMDITQMMGRAGR
jgi:ATP-dependent DNA helicase HFM1/MER3